MYRSVWRCRLCGEVFTGDVTYTDREVDIIMPPPIKGYRVKHECFGGDIGVAEFIGVRKGDEKDG